MDCWRKKKIQDSALDDRAPRGFVFLALCFDVVETGQQTRVASDQSIVCREAGKSTDPSLIKQTFTIHRRRSINRSTVHNKLNGETDGDVSQPCDDISAVMVICGEI